MQHSESLAALGKALAEAQTELDNVTKDAKNPHFKSEYATLAAITDTTRSVLAKHGLSILQMPSFGGGIVFVETMLLHSSGEWISETAGAPAQKQDAQGVGSAITYLRRYAQAGFCNIAQQDDDGNAASQAPSPRKANGNGASRGGGGAKAGAAWDRPMPFGVTQGKKLGEHTPASLARTIEWCRETPDRAAQFGDLIADIEATLVHLNGN